MTEKLLEAYISIPLSIIALFAIASGIGFGIALAYWLRDRISGVFVSKTGVQIHTNDVPVWSKIVDKIERIDTSTSKSIRKATARLAILDTDRYGMSAEVVLVNREANQPLIFAAYENHHTRELKLNADAYISDKANDIFEEIIKIWKKHFPELTGEIANAHACRWMKNALLPNLRRACVEKVAYYTKQIERSDVSKTVKEILVGCLEKNMQYVQCIDKLTVRPDINDKSSIIQPP